MVRGMVLWRVSTGACDFNGRPYVRFGVNESMAKRLFSLGNCRLNSKYMGMSPIISVLRTSVAALTDQKANW